MNRFSIVGTLNSGGPESEPEDAGRHPTANRDQPQEDAIWTLRESDPPIVVRDGNAGHTASLGYAGASLAKEWAGRQRKQSTHHGTRILPTTVSSSLLASGTDSGTLCRSLVPCARLPEEPGAVIPHAGICEGGTGQPVSLPQSARNANPTNHSSWNSTCWNSTRGRAE